MGYVCAVCGTQFELDGTRVEVEEVVAELVAEVVAPVAPKKARKKAVKKDG